MSDKVGLIICKNFSEEVTFIIKNNNIKNVKIVAFIPSCIYGEIGKNEQLEAIKSCQKNCDRIIIIGGTCCASLDKIVIDSEKCKIHRLEHCFELLTNRDIINHFISEKAYLVTPGWLRNQEKNIEILGFANEHSKIILLDTGVCEESLKNLQKFAEDVKLPYECIFVGVDFLRMFIEKILLQWCLECEKKENVFSLVKKTRQSVDSTSDKQQLAYILDSIHEGVFIIDSNYKAIFVNKAVAKLLNLKEFRDIIGKSAFDLVTDEYRKIVLERFKNILE